jgi:hypothetical protein
MGFSLFLEESANKKQTIRGHCKNSKSFSQKSFKIFQLMVRWHRMSTPSFISPGPLSREKREFYQCFGRLFPKVQILEAKNKEFFKNKKPMPLLRHKKRISGPSGQNGIILHSNRWEGLSVIKKLLKQHQKVRLV